jgi:hypothetical protein
VAAECLGVSIIINPVRVFLPRSWLDAKKCARGLDALRLYRSTMLTSSNFLRLVRPVLPYS